MKSRANRVPGLLLCALVGWLTERVAWLMYSSFEVDGLASSQGTLGLSARCVAPGELALGRRRAHGYDFAGLAENSDLGGLGVLSVLSELSSSSVNCLMRRSASDLRRINVPFTRPSS